MVTFSYVTQMSYPKWYRVTFSCDISCASGPRTPKYLGLHFIAYLHRHSKGLNLLSLKHFFVFYFMTKKVIPIQVINIKFRLMKS